jgi:ATP-dependent Clp protease ATP-binding subunit ClpA
MSCASSSVAFRPRSATASTTCAVRPLTRDEVREIARHYLDQIVHAGQSPARRSEVDDAALELLVTRGQSLPFGARFLKQAVSYWTAESFSARQMDGSCVGCRLCRKTRVAAVCAQRRRNSR